MMLAAGMTKRQKDEQKNAKVKRVRTIKKRNKRADEYKTVRYEDWYEQILDEVKDNGSNK